MNPVVKYVDICKRLKQYMKPYRTDLKKIRIGNMNDGGYVVADTSVEYDALYSYGSNDEIYFEKAFYEKYKKPCYVYDHTIDAITDKPSYINFFKEGVSNIKEKNLDTIDSHIEKNGHTNSKNLMAQIDVEGAEWVSLPVSKYLTNFSQIVVEFHLEDNLLKYDKIIDEVFGYLNKHFVCIHVHGNNYPLIPWIDNNFPKVFEVTYVRRDLVNMIEPETEPFPIKDLDFPNFNGRPDLHIDYYLDAIV